VDHIQNADLQRYLHGEIEPDGSGRMEAHLVICHDCRFVVESLAAEDAHLSEALSLNQADQDWVSSLDLWPAVKVQITPWYLQPQGYVIIIAMVLACGWILDQTLPLMAQAVLKSGPVDLLIRFMRRLFPAVLQFWFYLDRGGILVHIWPLPLLIGTAYLIRKRRPISHA